ncbi:putative DD34D transposase [Trichonephila clavipes]|nr:putative DD34D transposase [Trichonephila clavipes]
MERKRERETLRKQTIHRGNASQAAEIVHGFNGADTGQTLNSDTYCQKLDRLKLVTDQKRPELANRRGVMFHQDNAKPHTSVMTRQKFLELD